jgi:hypothetical protein
MSEYLVLFGASCLQEGRSGHSPMVEGQEWCRFPAQKAVSSVHRGRRSLLALYNTLLSWGNATSSSVLELFLIRSSVPASGVSPFASMIPYGIVSKSLEHTVGNGHRGSRCSMLGTAAIDVYCNLPITHLKRSAVLCNPGIPSIPPCIGSHSVTLSA